jgi:autotransporter adhesin
MGAPISQTASHQAELVGSAAGAVRLGNVADGRVAPESRDAVNGSQLAAVQRDVATAVHYDTASSGSGMNRATLATGQDGSGTTLANVAAGALSADSREAVNGSQLHATNQAVASAQLIANEALAMGQNAVSYDDASRSSVTLASGRAPAVIHNVAAGVADSDAVSVKQLATGLERVLGDSAAYTDPRVSELSFDLRNVSRTASAGVAGALAVAGMPQPYEAGRTMLAVGAGSYNGERAISFGLSGTTDDGRAVIKAGVGYDSQGKVSASAGFGFQL